MLLEKSVGTAHSHSSHVLDRSIPVRLQTPWRQEALKGLKISFKKTETIGDWLEDWITIRSPLK